jgi:hypothetical protein
MAYNVNQVGYSGTSKSAPASNNDIIASLFPGAQNLTASASDVIKNLLNGTPSPSTVRNSTATFGVGSGLGGGSGFLNRYGYDLYNKQGQERQSAGLGALNSLIGSTASPILTNQGQQQQNSQFYSNLGQSNNQFNQDLQLRQFLANLQAMGLGQSIISDGRTSLPTI